MTYGTSSAAQWSWTMKNEVRNVVIMRVQAAKIGHYNWVETLMKYATCLERMMNHRISTCILQIILVLDASRIMQTYIDL